ncbi:uncharacterized protein LOC135371072 [Ornithodoros turicata]|uniref:uncharacterized protein LOC135371072 n=1 Tax=Ornithodoros turicata TaxID=34597 RepID=UPI003139B166
MAFMMPVVKQDYDIYGNASRRSSVSSTSCPGSKSRKNSSSYSPGSSPESYESKGRRRSRAMSECPTEFPETARSGSKLSWSSFHAALVEKLKPAEPKSKSSQEPLRQS